MSLGIGTELIAVTRGRGGTSLPEVVVSGMVIVTVPYFFVTQDREITRRRG
jgi:hypothetical protein